MSDRPVDDALGRLLRAGDPAAGDPGLSSVERSAARRRVLAAAREHRQPNGWLVPATTVVALLALALGLAWRAPRSSPLRSAERSGPMTTTAVSDDAGHQVQFTTENGTLVVWVLLPRSTG